MVIILSAYVSIAIGLILLGAGLYLRHAENPRAPLVLGVGSVLVLTGIALLVWFMRAFS